MKRTAYNIKKIEKIIDKYEYISFDIFDTLIKRNVKRPSDIFRLTNLKYQQETGISIDNYPKLRKRAENKARNLSKKSEPNIDDIFNNIKLDSQKYDINRLKNIEIEMELIVCQKNVHFYPIYEYCIKNNKKIIITSDMYLNKEYIESLLKKADIKHYNYLFISNDVKLNKHNGSIYKYILKQLNIKSKQLIHIGDSKRGDYIQARVHNIRSILIPKYLKNCYKEGKEEYEDNLDYSVLKAFINNNLNNKESIYFNIGYEALGPLLYGYSKWLLKELIKSKKKKVFFLAREGNLLKKTFDIINECRIDTEYLHISRRSVRPALLENVSSFDDLRGIIKIKPTSTIEKFLKDIGLYDEKHLAILEKKGLNKKTKINDIKNIKEIFELLKMDMQANASNEKNMILGYLKSKGFENNIAISDIGWAGSMQKSLKAIFNTYEIAGYYVGMTNDNMELEKYAYLKNYEKIRPFVHLFENLFLAQHGTTLKYREKSGKYFPILDEYEYTDNEMNMIVDIQNGAIKFVTDFNINPISKIIELNSNTAFEELEEMGLNPTLKDLKLFKDMPYVETVKMNLVEGKGLITYIFDLKKCKDDFFNSGWKIGFLKNLLKIKLPYYRIYKSLLKHKEK